MRNHFRSIATTTLFIAGALCSSCDAPVAPDQRHVTVEAPADTPAPAPNPAQAAPSEAVADPKPDTRQNESLPAANDNGTGRVLFTNVQISRLARGMTTDAVRDILGPNPVAVGGDGDAVQVLRWTDAAGNTCTVRFDSGALRTHSGLRLNEAPPARTSDGAAAPEMDGRPVAEIAPGVFIPLERAVAAATGQPQGIVATPNRPPAPAPDAAPQSDTAAHETPTPPAVPTPEASGPTVVVAGAGNDNQGAGSYRPRARLPEFTRSIEKGRYEIRLINPTASPITAGVRQGKLGVDVTVPAAGRASVFVDRGIYALYHLREDQPYTLNEMTAISIDGFQASDLEVHLHPGGTEIRPIDYSELEPN